MAEWSMAHAWKACIGKPIQGSNPCPTATENLQKQIFFVFWPFDLKKDIRHY